MSSQDIRWIQRYDNFTKAVKQLTRFLEKNDLNEMKEQGLIQCFQYTYELAWKVLKDFFEDQGEMYVMGIRDAFRLAFNRGLINDGEVWMDMIKSRALTSHTYNEETARMVIQSIRSGFFEEFVKLQARFENLKQQAS